MRRARRVAHELLAHARDVGLVISRGTCQSGAYGRGEARSSASSLFGLERLPPTAAARSSPCVPRVRAAGRARDSVFLQKSMTRFIAASFSSDTFRRTSAKCGFGAHVRRLGHHQRARAERKLPEVHQVQSLAVPLSELYCTSAKDDAVFQSQTPNVIGAKRALAMVLKSP